MQEGTLVVGTDMSSRGDDAIVDGLLWLASDPSCVMHVVHVLEPGKIFHVPGRPELEQEARALADGPSALRRRIQFDAALNGLPYTAARIHTHVRLGRPVEALLQACVDLDADLLLVGTHGRTGLQRMLLGSVAQRLLREAHCPVLVARTKSYHGLSKSSPPAKASQLEQTSRT